MAFYLDSADLSQAQAAMDWGWVHGITTNPTLMAQQSQSPEQILAQLRRICRGELYYQLMAPDLPQMIREAHLAYDIVGPQLVLKIPATHHGFRAVAQLAPRMTCSVTGIYSAAQAAIAQAAGATYAIAYVNRATRLLGNGIELVQGMAQVLAGTKTQILAASLKSSEEAVAARIAGAKHLTLPYDLLKTLADHPLSEQTAAAFHQSGRGLNLETH
ncbi:transaldolase family protein [Lyngbya confervoides]|uniref:Transaldolase n=1 Tax=Lyngbya confervoides BDU141951 TaxID=1574623 RepID=A0ABD4T0Z3_9CYAN|nr:transaldolase family protein [Lyngbya confervoides]MCM1982252.1 transaldolase [Lyngbya confervoides BDU141951]